MPSGAPKRPLAALLSFLYFLTNCVCSHAAEAGFWADRRDRARQAGLPAAGPADLLRGWPAADPVTPSVSWPASALRGAPADFAAENASLLNAFPAACGSFRRVLPPLGAPSRGVVVHVQDVHQNGEAQKNIGGIVRALSDGKVAGLVALEGAFAPVDLARYRAFPDRGAVRTAADALLREGTVSGPVHAALTAADFPPLIGVDDAVHHAANVRAYLASAPRAAERKAALAAERAALDAREAAAFGPDLKAFDEKVRSHRAGKTSLGDHVRALSAAVPGAARGPVGLFLRAVEMERALDFKVVEAERARLVERLARALSPTQIDALARRSAAQRLGGLPPADFYRSLQALCAGCGVPLSDFPAMDRYVRYVLLADGIDGEDLLEAVDALEASAYARLARTLGEKSLLADDARLRLAAKLADFALTPREWREYAAASAPALSSFEDFYREALARDRAMSDNLIRALGERKVRTALLVTGGFHAPGLDERLRRAGFTVVTVVPRVEKLDAAQGSAYLGVFSREKTPLEKLFRGEKLFLAPEQWTPEKALRADGAVALAVEAADPARPSDGGAVLRALSPELSDYNLSTRDVPGGAEARLEKAGAAAAVRLAAKTRADGGLDVDGGAAEVSAADRWGARTGAGVRRIFRGIGRLAFEIRRRAPESGKPSLQEWLNGEAAARLETPIVVLIAFAPAPLAAALARWYVRHYHPPSSGGVQRARFALLEEMTAKARAGSAGLLSTVLWAPAVFAALFLAARAVDASPPAAAAAGLLGALSALPVPLVRMFRRNVPLHLEINARPGGPAMSGLSDDGRGEDQAGGGPSASAFDFKDAPQLSPPDRDSVIRTFQETALLQVTLENCLGIPAPPPGTIKEVRVSLLDNSGGTRVAYLVDVLPEGSAFEPAQFVMKITRFTSADANTVAHEVKSRLVNAALGKTDGFFGFLDDGKFIVTGPRFPGRSYESVQHALHAPEEVYAVQKAIFVEALSVWWTLNGVFIQDPHRGNFIVQTGGARAKLDPKAVLIDKGFIRWKGGSIPFRFERNATGGVTPVDPAGSDLKDLSSWLTKKSPAELADDLVDNLSISGMELDLDTGRPVSTHAHPFRYDALADAAVDVLGAPEAEAFFRSVAESAHARPERAQFLEAGRRAIFKRRLESSTLWEYMEKDYLSFFRRIGAGEGTRLAAVGLRNNFFVPLAADYLGIRHVGFEIQADKVERVRRMVESFEGGAQVIAGAFSAEPGSASSVLPDRSQDMVLMPTGVLSDPLPVSNHQSALREALRVVKDGGLLVVGTVGFPDFERRKLTETLRGVLESPEWNGRVELRPMGEDWPRDLDRYAIQAYYRVYFLNPAEAPAAGAAQGAGLQAFGPETSFAPEAGDEVLRSPADVARLYGGRDVVIVEPHPDDAALSMGVLAREISRAARSVVLAGATSGWSGVAGDGTMERKRDIRIEEGRAGARAMGIGDYVNLLMDPPKAREAAADHVDGRRVDFRTEYAPFSAEALQALDAFVAGRAGPDAVWFLPFPFVKGRHHPVHEMTSRAFLEALRQRGFAGRVVFYETYEGTFGAEGGEANFTDEGVRPNVHRVLSTEGVGWKEALIREYASQVARNHGYAVDFRRRNASYAAPFNAARPGEEAAAVERLWSGHLRLSPPAPSAAFGDEMSDAASAFRAAVEARDAAVPHGTSADDGWRRFEEMARGRMQENGTLLKPAPDGGAWLLVPSRSYRKDVVRFMKELEIPPAGELRGDGSLSAVGAAGGGRSLGLVYRLPPSEEFAGRVAGRGYMRPTFPAPGGPADSYVDPEFFWRTVARGEYPLYDIHDLSVHLPFASRARFEAIRPLAALTAAAGEALKAGEIPSRFREPLLNAWREIHNVVFTEDYQGLEPVLDRFFLYLRMNMRMSSASPAAADVEKYLSWLRRNADGFPPAVAEYLRGKGLVPPGAASVEKAASLETGSLSAPLLTPAFKERHGVIARGVDEILGVLVGAAEKNGGPDVPVIAVNGPAAAGKTTMTAAWLGRLRALGRPVVLLSQDRYLRDPAALEVLRRAVADGKLEWRDYWRQNKDLPAFHGALSDIRRFKGDASKEILEVELPGPYLPGTSERGPPEKLRITRGTVVIVEGIGVVNPETSDFFDVSALMDVESEEVRFSRYFNRLRERGNPRADDRDHWLKHFESYQWRIAAQIRGDASSLHGFVIDNSDVGRPVLHSLAERAPESAPAAGPSTEKPSAREPREQGSPPASLVYVVLRALGVEEATAVRWGKRGLVAELAFFGGGTLLGVFVHPPLLQLIPQASTVWFLLHLMPLFLAPRAASVGEWSRGLFTAGAAYAAIFLKLYPEAAQTSSAALALAALLAHLAYDLWSFSGRQNFAAADGKSVLPPRAGMTEEELASLRAARAVDLLEEKGGPEDLSPKELREARGALEAAAALGVSSPWAFLWLGILKGGPADKKTYRAELDALNASRRSPLPEAEEVLRLPLWANEGLAASRERYDVEKSRFAVGGVTEVFRALDRAAKRTRVIRTLRRGKEGMQSFFWREYVVHRWLQDRVPGLVKVWGIARWLGQPDGMVMEEAERGDLRAFLKGEPLDAGRAVPLARRILTTLAALHGAGYLHNDLKTENFFIPAGGGLADVLLGDLGFVCTKEAGREGGRLFGTPAFLAPEVLRTGRVDEASDLYQVGCVLFEALTGKPAFPETSLLRDHLAAKSNPSGLRARLDAAGVPEEIALFVLGLMHPHADARPRTALEALKALEKATAKSGAPRGPPAARPRRWVRYPRSQARSAADRLRAVPAARPRAMSSIAQLIARSLGADEKTASNWGLAGLAVESPLLSLLSAFVNQHLGPIVLWGPVTPGPVVVLLGLAFFAGAHASLERRVEGDKVRSSPERRFLWFMFPLFLYAVNTSFSPINFAAAVHFGMDIYALFPDKAPDGTEFDDVPFGLHPAYVDHDRAVKRAADPGQRWTRGLYLGAGLDVVNFLLSNDTPEGVFVSKDFEVNARHLQRILQRERTLDESAMTTEELTARRAFRKHFYFMGSGAEAKGFPKFPFLPLMEGLRALKIDLSRAAVESEGGVAVLKFAWAYPGREEREYKIRFIQGDVESLGGNRKFQRELKQGFDAVYVRAGQTIPASYGKFVPLLEPHVNPGGAFVTDDHAGIAGTEIDLSKTFPLPWPETTLKKQRGLERHALAVREIYIDELLAAAPDLSLDIRYYGWKVRVRLKPAAPPAPGAAPVERKPPSSVEKPPPPGKPAPSSVRTPSLPARRPREERKQLYALEHPTAPEASSAAGEEDALPPAEEPQAPSLGTLSLPKDVRWDGVRFKQRAGNALLGQPRLRAAVKSLLAEIQVGAYGKPLPSIGLDHFQKRLGNFRLVYQRTPGGILVLDFALKNAIKRSGGRVKADYYDTKLKEGPELDPDGHRELVAFLDKPLRRTNGNGGVVLLPVMVLLAAAPFFWIFPGMAFAALAGGITVFLKGRRAPPLSADRADAARIVRAAEGGGVFTAADLRALFPAQESEGVADFARPGSSVDRRFLGRLRADGGRGLTAALTEELRRRGISRLSPADLASSILRRAAPAPSASVAAPGTRAAVVFVVGPTDLPTARALAAEAARSGLPLLLAAGAEGVAPALEALARESGGAALFLKRPNPRKGLDRAFVDDLNAALTEALAGLGADPARVTVAASAGLPWALRPADLAGSGLLESLRRALLDILASDAVGPREILLLLRVVAAVAANA